MGWVSRTFLIGVFLSTSAHASIVDTDDRVIVEDAESHGLSAVGSLSVYFLEKNGNPNRKELCTGTLIEGDIVMTSAHCFVDPFHSGYTISAQFCVSRRNPLCADVERVYLATPDPYQPSEKSRDVAFLKLRTSVEGGDLRPIALRSRVIAFRYFEPIKDVSLMGYSDDIGSGQLPWIHRDCQILGHPSDGSYIHDCDTANGASGAPILARNSSNDWVFVGMHFRSSPNYGNEAVPVNALIIHYQNAMKVLRK